MEQVYKLTNQQKKLLSKFTKSINLFPTRMLNTGPTGVDSKTPDEVTNRFALAIVAAKLLSGDKTNVEKWQAVDQNFPQVSKK